MPPTPHRIVSEVLAPRVGPWWLLVAALAAVAVPAEAQDGELNLDAPPGLETVDVVEHLDGPVPLDATFRNHAGERVTLGEYFDGRRPVLLNLVYHSCPTFCSLVLDATREVLQGQAWTVGEEFQVVTLSIDPRDTPEVAADARQRLLHRYSRDAAEEGWHFLVAERTLSEQEAVSALGIDPQVQRVMDATGFQAQWMPAQGQFAHPGVIMLLTPEGRLARYLYGLEYAPSDIRLGLLEASEGRSISTVERVLLYCYRYDASQGTYVVMAWRVMQIGGGLTALLLFLVLGYFWTRELRRGDGSPPTGPGPVSRVDPTSPESRAAQAPT
jgi:protein SCO1/2